MNELIPVEQSQEAGELAIVAREQAEIQSGIISAKKFPRDEQKSYARVMNSMTRESMAAAAEYSFPRGGKAIVGPSVDLARETARCWGNVRYGLRIVSADDAQVHIRGFAIDMETNTYAEAEDIFKPLIQRKNKHTDKTEWKTPDERDLRELINRRGAICVRNALLQILPPDVIDDACAKARETLQKAAAGNLSGNREDTLRKIVLAYHKLGVSKEMLEEFLGHDLTLIDGAELAEIQRVWKSINDGQSRREEHFTFAQAEKPSVKDRLAEKVKAIKPKTDEAEEGKSEQLTAY